MSSRHTPDTTTKEYGGRSKKTINAYAQGICPECGGNLTGSDDITTDDCVHFWTVKVCDDCHADITIAFNARFSGMTVTIQEG